MNTKKFTLLAVLFISAFYTLLVLKDPYNHYILHAVNLVIHEAGHSLFFFFGETLYILGGSLLQILVPIIFAVYFLRQQKYFSVAIMLLWLSVNFVEVAIYAGDAINMYLPLLGGDSSTHDWNAILTNWNILSSAPIFEKVFRVLGHISFVGAIMLGLFAIKETE